MPDHKLVEGLDRDTADRIACSDCGWRGRDSDPGDGLVGAGMMTCPKCGVGNVDYEYHEGVRCVGCNTLDYVQPLRDDHGRYCSRLCQLQAEYARSLQTAALDAKEPGA